jgi:uncharacterized protein
MENRFSRTVLLLAVALGSALLALATQRMFFPSAAVHAQENAQTALPKHGMGKKLWVILVTDVPGGRASEPDAGRRHLAHQVDLEKRGIMFGAGPVTDPSGKHEYGMIIVRADSADEAKRIAESDPMQSEGRRTYTLHEWTLNEGRIGLTMDYSDGTFKMN